MRVKINIVVKGMSYKSVENMHNKFEKKSKIKIDSKNYVVARGKIRIPPVRKLIVSSF